MGGMDNGGSTQINRAADKNRPPGGATVADIVAIAVAERPWAKKAPWAADEAGISSGARMINRCVSLAAGTN